MGVPQDTPLPDTHAGSEVLSPRQSPLPLLQNLLRGIGLIRRWSIKHMTEELEGLR